MKHMSRASRIKLASNPLGAAFPGLYAFKYAGAGYIKTTNEFSAASFQFTSHPGATYNPADAIYANGKLTVIGYNGVNTDIWNSVDGDTFTRATTITWGGGPVLPYDGALNLKSIAYGNGVYVALASENYVVQSTDGVNWKTYDTKFSTGGNLGGNRVMSVCFGNGRFVAVSLADKVITSINGINWTQVANTLALGKISYANGKWFGSGRPTSYQYISDDGVNWYTNGIAGASNIVYSNGKYFAAGTDGNIYSSTTGLSGSWTIVASSLQPPMSNLVVRGLDMAYGSANGYIIYSRNGGLTWSQQWMGSNSVSYPVIALP